MDLTAESVRRQREQHMVDVGETVGVSEELLLPESVDDVLFWRVEVSGRGCAAAVCS